MRDAKRIEGLTEVPVADVVERNRLRPVSEAGIAALMSSITDLGEITDAIHVRKVKHKAGELVLMAGSHRLEAARRLGWTIIPAVVWDCSDDWALLKEIDDNAAGAELTALDTAVFLSERKRVYEKLHPETKAGTFKGNQHTKDVVAEPSSVTSFAAATAEKFGITERQVRKIVAAGESLLSGERLLLRQANRSVTLKDLIEIGKIGDAAERGDVVMRLYRGTAKSAAEARKHIRGGDAVNTDDALGGNLTDAAARKLRDAWDRTPMAAQRRFVEDHRDALRALLDRLDGPEDA